MSFLSKIKSFFTRREEKSLKQFFAEYLKIKSELEVSDIKLTGKELNFKVAFRGNLVPFWISSKDEISLDKVDAKVQDSLSIIATGLALGLNLVEVSQELKSH